MEKITTWLCFIVAIVCFGTGIAGILGYTIPNPVSILTCFASAGLYFIIGCNGTGGEK